ncbi:MAG: type I-E CRISPR-associated protein Cas5/CasD [Methyloversatilis sp.]|uniref:type I-E CRISPR-associated protein Cas5/CasD n=1 Tax=Methyloversatilis sp. TaxID=2569862 RepID=UPI0027359A11|nr:type I-E CRISPR-associated protein Cas5/CasD [Methyloversatilis sp.]MDP3872862.1 type I-E CRISPR-associated protein Cas5/CasD [Methyloversatilis sp.]
MAMHLLLRLEGPLMAFGGETIDNLGVIRDFPAQSMVTGLIANALGWRREDSTEHDRLQARLLFGARLDRAGSRLTDFQTAELHKDDKGWTTIGAPEGRAGGEGTYKGQHLRYRDYHADAVALIALRLDPAEESPTLEDVAAALHRPARPLFLGRKSCLPAVPLFAGWCEAPDLLGALQSAAPVTANTRPRVLWPAGEGELSGSRQIDVCDERNWTSGVHGGWRPVCEGVLSRETGA